MSERSGWLKKRAVAEADKVKDEHKEAGTPIDTIDMVEAIEAVAREFAERAVDAAVLARGNGHISDFVDAADQDETP